MICMHSAAVRSPLFDVICRSGCPCGSGRSGGELRQHIRGGHGKWLECVKCIDCIYIESVVKCYMVHTVRLLESYNVTEKRSDVCCRF